MRLRELGASEECSARFHAPVGLDIGASGLREIALSIVSEMRAVLDRRGGGTLREHRGAIHGTRGDGGSVTAIVEQSLPGVAA